MVEEIIIEDLPQTDPPQNQDGGDSPLKSLFNEYNPKLKIAKDYTEFEVLMRDKNNRKAFFDEFNPKIKLAKDFDEFESVLNIVPQQPQPKEVSQTTATNLTESQYNEYKNKEKQISDLYQTSLDFRKKIEEAAKKDKVSNKNRLLITENEMIGLQLDSISKLDNYLQFSKREKVNGLIQTYNQNLDKLSNNNYLKKEDVAKYKEIVGRLNSLISEVSPIRDYISKQQKKPSKQEIAKEQELTPIQGQYSVVVNDLLELRNLKKESNRVIKKVGQVAYGAMGAGGVTEGYDDPLDVEAKNRAKEKYLAAKKDIATQYNLKEDAVDFAINNLESYVGNNYILKVAKETNENPYAGERLAAAINYQIPLDQALLEKVKNNEITKGTYDDIWRNFLASQRSTTMSNSQKRDSVKYTLMLLREHLPYEQANQLSKYAIKDGANVYGNMGKGDIEAERQTIENAGELGDNAIRALAFLKDTDQNSYNKYIDAVIPKYALQTEEQILAWESKQKELEEIGLNLKYRRDAENLKNLENKIKKGDYTEVDLLQYNKAVEVNNENVAEFDKIKEKFPKAARYDLEFIAQELLGEQPLNEIGLFGVNLADNILDIPKGVGSLLSSPFKSKEEAQLDRLQTSGESKTNAVLNNRLESRKSSTNIGGVVEVLDSDIQAKIDEIKKSNNDYWYKNSQIKNLLSENPNAYTINKEKKKETNSFRVKLGSVSDQTSEVFPEILMALTGAAGARLLTGAKLGTKGQLLNNAFAEFTTSYQDNKVQTVEQGLKEGDALRRTIVQTIFSAVGDEFGAVMKAVRRLPKKYSSLFDNFTEKEFNKFLQGKAFSKLENIGLAVKDIAAGSAKTAAIGVGANIANDVLEGKDIDWSEKIKEFKDMAVDMGLLSTIARGIGAIKNFKDISDDRLLGIFDAATKPEEYKSILKTNVDNGKISKDDAINILNRIDAVSKVYNETSFTDVNGNLLTESKKIKMFGDVLRKNELVKESSTNVAPIRKEAIEKELGLIDERMNKLAEESPEQYIIDGKEVTKEEFIKTDLTDKKWRINNGDARLIERTIDKFGGAFDKTQLDSAYDKSNVKNATPKQEENNVEITKESVAEAKPKEIDEIKVGEMLDKKGTYKGQKGYFSQDGKTVIFKVDGKNKEYEIGNIDEIKELPISEFEIKHEQSVVTFDESGNVSVRGESFKNRYSDPLQAINYDKNGNIVSVTLENSKGEKRTFKKNIAEDIAYQIHLKEITKNNETRQQFEQHINEDGAAKSEIDNARLQEVTTPKPIENNAAIPREKIGAKPKEVKVETQPIEVSSKGDDVVKSNTFTRDDLPNATDKNAPNWLKTTNVDDIESKLNKGDKITFFAEKERNGIWDGKMIVDDKGTKWGTLGILSDKDGFIRNDSAIEKEQSKPTEVKAEQPNVSESNSALRDVESIEDRNKQTEAKIKNKGLFLAEYDKNGNKIGDSVGEIISQSNIAPIATSVREQNGFEFVEFSNPQTGKVDVIVTGDTKGNYVGFYRLYENGKPTNKWSSKMNSKDKNAFKTMMSGVQEMLPQGHEYSEKTSISTDGLRVWNQQLQRGYELQYGNNGKLITDTVAINGDALVNELGINVNQGNFDNIRVSNKEDFNKVKKALLPYLENFGLNESNINWVNGTVEIDLPVLKKSESLLSKEQTKTEVKDKGVGSGAGGDVDATTKALEGLSIDESSEIARLVSKNEIKIKSTNVKDVEKLLNQKGNPKKGDILNIGGTDWEVNKINKRQIWDSTKKEFKDADGYEIQIRNSKNGETYTIRTDNNNSFKGSELSVREKLSNYEKQIAEAYHKAKADGSNPELVKAVEQSLPTQEVKAEQPNVSEIEPLEIIDLGDKLENESGFLSEEEQSKGYTPVTLSGMTEAERKAEIEARAGKKMSEKQKEENYLAELAKKADALSYNAKKDAQTNLRQIIRKLNADAGYEKYKYNGIKVQKRTNIKTGALKGSTRWTSVGVKYVETGNTSIVENGTVLRDRSVEVQERYEQLMDILPNLKVPDASNKQTLSEEQIKAAIQDVNDGIPSVAAENFLNTLESGLEKGVFDWRGGEPIRLKDLIEQEEVTSVFDEKGLEDWLNEGSKLTLENEQILLDNIENILYEYAEETDVKGEVQVNEPATKIGSDKKAEPNSESQKPNGKNEEVKAENAKPKEERPKDKAEPAKQQTSAKPKEKAIIDVAKVLKEKTIFDKNIATDIADKLEGFADWLHNMDKGKLQSSLLAIPKAILEEASKGAAKILRTTNNLAKAVDHFIDEVKDYYKGNDLRGETEKLFGKYFGEKSEPIEPPKTTAKTNFLNDKNIPLTDEKITALSAETSEYTGVKVSNELRESTKASLDLLQQEGAKWVAEAKKLFPGKTQYALEMIRAINQLDGTNNLSVTKKAVSLVSLLESIDRDLMYVDLSKAERETMVGYRNNLLRLRAKLTKDVSLALNAQRLIYKLYNGKYKTKEVVGRMVGAEKAEFVDEVVANMEKFDVEITQDAIDLVQKEVSKPFESETVTKATKTAPITENQVTKNRKKYANILKNTVSESQYEKLKNEIRDISKKIICPQNKK